MCPCTVVGQDTIPPVASSCPQSITQTIRTGMPSVTVSWIEPTATDNSGMTPTVTQSHQPGDSFNIGTTAVTYTFTDVAGNQATCTFDVVIGNYFSVQISFWVGC